MQNDENREDHKKVKKIIYMTGLVLCIGMTACSSKGDISSAVGPEMILNQVEMPDIMRNGMQNIEDADAPNRAADQMGIVIKVEFDLLTISSIPVMDAVRMPDVDMSFPNSPDERPRQGRERSDISGPDGQMANAERPNMPRPEGQMPEGERSDMPFFDSENRPDFENGAMPNGIMLWGEEQEIVILTNTLIKQITMIENIPEIVEIQAEEIPENEMVQIWLDTNGNAEYIQVFSYKNV